MNVDAGIDYLAEGGLNLAAVLDTASLPRRAAGMMIQSGAPLDAYRRLVLIGHGGRRMWEAVQAQGMQAADPIDDYSTALAKRFISDYLDSAPHLWLYPNTAYLIPLQQLGEAAGWSHPSPIGSGISPTYGVWFAYRAAFLIDADLPLVREEPVPSPCASCVQKPCIGACPVGAVGPASFDIDACVQHRLLPLSPCADRCLARLACPYFPEHRYSEPQIQYHYGRSLDSLRSWRAANR